MAVDYTQKNTVLINQHVILSQRIETSLEKIHANSKIKRGIIFLISFKYKEEKICFNKKQCHKAKHLYFPASKYLK